MSTISFLQANVRKKYESRESIESKILILKEQLRYLTTDYYKKAYIILKEIVKLRNLQLQTKSAKGRKGKLYGLTKLAQEDGIKLTRHQISSIMLQDYFSSKTNQLIDDGKIKTASVIAILKRDKRYREAPIQDKIIQKKIHGELTMHDLHYLPKEVIEGKITKKEIISADKDLLNYYFRVSNILNGLRTSANLYSNRPSVLKLMRATERMYKELEDILKFGKALKRK